MSYSLSPRDDAGKGARKLLRKEIGRALKDLAGDGNRIRAESVHSARKHFKKIRGLLRLMRPALGEKVFTRENHFFRDAGRAISAARDAAVLVETFDQIREAIGGKNAAGLNRLRAPLETAREQSAANPASQAGLEKLKEDLAAAIDRGDALPLGGSDAAGLCAALSGIYRQGRQCMRASIADPSPEIFHEWRKRAKDLRHQLQLLEKGWPETLGPLVKEAKRLGELLGENHDLDVLEQKLISLNRRVRAGKALEELRDGISARQHVLHREAWKLGAKLYAEKPGAFARRILAYWTA